MIHNNQSLLYISYSWNFRHRLVRLYWYCFSSDSSRKMTRFPDGPVVLECDWMWLAPSNWLQSSIFLGFSWLFLLSTLKSDTRAVSSLPQAVLRNGSWLAMKSWKKIWRPLEHWGVHLAPTMPFLIHSSPVIHSDILRQSPTVLPVIAIPRQTCMSLMLDASWTYIDLLAERVPRNSSFYLAAIRQMEFDQHCCEMHMNLCKLAGMVALWGTALL